MKRGRAIALPASFSLGHGLFGPMATGFSPARGRSPSVAVLPFVTLAGADTVIADGITDDLITHLSRLSQIRVIGRSTMFTYKDQSPDARRLGRELDIDHVVAGTVRSGAQRIVVNVELVDARDGIQQWAERITDDEADWLNAVDIISRRIARSLNLELMDVASRAVRDRSGDASHAMSLAMRGWVELFSKPQTAESNRAASGWLNEALAIDAGLALAWTGLAYAAYRAASFGWDERTLADGFWHAVELAERAIDLDPRAADAYYAMGQSLNGLDELERAQAAHEACIALNPSHAPAYAALGQTRMFLGHPEETRALCDRAFLFSPREPLRAIWHRSKGLAALFLDDPVSAVADAQAAIAMNAKYPSAYVVLAVGAMRLGQRALAESAVATLRSMPRFRTIAEVRAFHARPRRERYSRMLEALLADLNAAGMPDG
jgi:TolB-like protein